MIWGQKNEIGLFIHIWDEAIVSVVGKDYHGYKCVTISESCYLQKVKLKIKIKNQDQGKTPTYLFVSLH